MALFERYIGVDYSGAETADSSLPGLRVYASDREGPPREILPPPSPRKYWTRRGAAEWLGHQLDLAASPFVGIDHAFSFPIDYFQSNPLSFDWTNWVAFLEDFQLHWPTDERNVYVDFVREGLVGNGSARCGKRTWRMGARPKTIP